jgi:hypothetical protein
MGWYYTYGATRKNVITELTPVEVARDGGGCFRTLRHCCRGNTLYALHESVAPDASSTKWIGIYLMQRSKEGWGYKPMDESMGPYQYNCPPSYLDEASAPVNETAANWREKVRQFVAQKAAQNAKRPSVGEIWSCTGTSCKRIRIAKVEGRRIEAFNLSGGGYYRIPKKLLGERMAETGTP